MAFVTGECCCSRSICISQVEADNTTLARDLWPGASGRLTVDNEDITQLPRSRRLPNEHEELCRWMCVDPCGVDKSTVAWIQPEGDDDEERTEVTIRVQGFVEQISVGMLGSWNG